MKTQRIECVFQQLSTSNLIDNAYVTSNGNTLLQCTQDPNKAYNKKHLLFQRSECRGKWI